MTSEPSEASDRRKQAIEYEIRAGVPWGAFIECYNEEPAIFDPKIAGEKPDKYAERLEAARAICARCPVIEQCLKEAYELKDFDTFRGGLVGNERKAVAKQQRAATIRLRRAS